MYRRTISIILLSFLLVLLSCNNTNRKKESPAVVTPVIKKFKMVDIPVMLTTQQDKIDFMVEHYWDNYDFKDTSLISQEEVTEQGFADFVNLLNNIPIDKARMAININLKKSLVDTNMFLHFTSLYEKYLYDPNSPFRSEELYIPALQFIVNDSSIDATNKIRPSSQLELALKNRVGDKAVDFEYTLLSGKKQSLNNLKSEYTILFFYNPDCETCKAVREQILVSDVVNNMKGRIKILALYPDKDIELWRKYYDNIPKEWINAYDDGEFITRKNIYDLKAIPTLYLLDKDKKVVLKDVDFVTLNGFISSLI